MKVISLKCPECNASLSIEEGRTQCFCQYCGTKILLDDGSTTYTYRKIDEARLKEAEVRLRELEIEQEEKRANRKKSKLKIAVTIFLGIMTFLFLISGSKELGGIAIGCLAAIVYMWQDLI